MVVNDQEFVLEDFTPILGNIQLNVHVSTDGRLSKYASNSINYCSCLFTNFNSFSLPYVTGQLNKFEPSGEKLPLGQVLHTYCCHKKTCSYLHFELEPLLDILPFGSVVDAWVDIGQLCDSLSYVAKMPHKFSTILERYPYVWNRSSQQLFDSMSQTCHYSKVFAENSQGEAIGIHCQFYLMRLTTGNSIIASYFIPSMFKGVTLTLDSSLHRCLSFHAFHAIPIMKFGVNQVAAIADKSLLFTLEFEEAFNLTFSILRAYDHSTLAYHCIHKSKVMALISHISSYAHDNAFTELFVVAYAMVQVELDRNFSMSVSHKTPEFIQLNLIGQAPLLDTLVSHLICSFFREELKFPNHLIVQLLGSHLAMVESAKRISKYGMLMKLVAVFEELVMIWYDNLQVSINRLDARVEYEFWANSDVECCRPKDDMIYSTCIGDNKKGCDCNSLEIGNACLVIQDVNVVILHNLAALEANWLIWLVDQMHRGIALAIGVSRQDFIWDANMDRDSNENNMIFVLFYSNLEGKVPF
ncbi:hypothetical protein MTR67_007593 [Solanum verrucosum]|uniref:Uncharacterized protein n=1 Tax=Solanum verrucosum TaxID=315347 RepID=A0AAF0Q0H9_SOLVR|nr:hypothetical protein MTR67_007593 [Solanum verrucosum]